MRMADAAKVAQDFQAQGLDVVSTAGGIVVGKGKGGEFLVYRNQSLEFHGGSGNGILSGFSAPRAFEIRIMPLEGRAPLLVIQVPIEHEDEVRQLTPILSHLFQAINVSAS